jgi:hypothetical protein
MRSEANVLRYHSGEGRQKRDIKVILKKDIKDAIIFF